MRLRQRRLTIEGLAGTNPIRSGNSSRRAMQCGFTTPGMILTAYACC
jgi:aerobic-type carbon monoxide dehydrogenase small subunit (CoxS/CutS family)